MATNQPNLRTDLFQALFHRYGEDATDGHLLRQFLWQRDEAAFETLVRRHGPMILGVCRRILGNVTDADDAFQATFVVLLRKAPTLASRNVLGDWLHGVARRTALKARDAAIQRRLKEQGGGRPAVQEETGRNDWLPLLDEALNCLPAKYRLPIVLCDLEGKTRQEAAKQLDWPEGTVAGRLARGRALLAKRLLRRVQILSGVVPGVLAGSAAQAVLPAGLVKTTVQAATLVATGKVIAQGVLSAGALTAAKGVLQTMFWKKMKVCALVLLLVGVVLAGVGSWTFQVLAGDQQPLPKAKETNAPQHLPEKGATAKPALSKQPQENKTSRDRYQALAKAAKDQYEVRWDEYCAGKTTVDFVHPWSVKWLKAQVRLCENKADEVAAYKAHLERLKELEKVTKARYDADIIPASQYYQVIYHRIEAEIWLDEATRKK